MKLCLCLLMAVMAAASADQGFYQPQPAAQSAPSGYNNYYDYQHQPAKRQGWLDRLFGSNRRQGLDDLFGGGLGGLAVIGPVFMLVLAVIAIAAVAYAISELNSSGRGLDSDEWEVDHSVWMDQLHKDFEDSWSVQ